MAKIDTFKSDVPLCIHCGEDHTLLVTKTVDKGYVRMHCDVCGASWDPEPKTDVSGNVMDGP